MAAQGFDTARFSIGGFIPANKLLKSADETKVILTEGIDDPDISTGQLHSQGRVACRGMGVPERDQHSYCRDAYLQITAEGKTSHQQDPHSDKRVGLFAVICALTNPMEQGRDKKRPHQDGRERLAGAVGFEPTIHGTKADALPLGYAPVAEWRNVTANAWAIKPEESRICIICLLIAG